MGSKPEARRGSIASCLAAKEAIVRWSKVAEAPLAYLAHLIEVNWRLRIHPVEPSSACSTCLLALACPDGSWVVGGLGDGMVVTRTGNLLTTVVGDREGTFGNETEALGASSGGRSWTLKRLGPSAQERLAVLATDGVSDDLIPEKLAAFCDWLIEDFHGLTPPQRWRQLAAAMRAWPTPKHLDDKTLGVLRTTVFPTGGPE